MSKSVTPPLSLKESGPLVSVVLPVYNGKKYLATAIDSILAQTFKNFELIMIDDGSSDGSQQLMREYEQLDNRVRLFLRENRGLATTLNDSIDLARGMWIARMDQDDIALPHRLERQLEWLNATGADISGSWIQRFGTSDKQVLKLRETDDAIKMEMLFYSPFAHPTVMMRTALVRQLRYDSAWEKAEDYDLWERAIEAGWKMTNVPEVLLFYRVHAKQISTQTGYQQQKLGQEIRRRYWGFVFCAMQLNTESIDKTLKIFESSSAVDIDALDASITQLLQHTYGESKAVIFDHATRLYLRAAAHCPSIVSRWSRLNSQFGRGGGYSTKFKLWFFRALRIEMDGEVFGQLKKLYVWGMCGK